MTTEQSAKAVRIRHPAGLANLELASTPLHVDI